MEWNEDNKIWDRRFDCERRLMNIINDTVGLSTDKQPKSIFLNRRNKNLTCKRDLYIQRFTDLDICFYDYIFICNFIATGPKTWEAMLFHNFSNLSVKAYYSFDHMRYPTRTFSLTYGTSNEITHLFIKDRTLQFNKGKMIT